MADFFEQQVREEREAQVQRYAELSIGRALSRGADDLRPQTAGPIAEDEAVARWLQEEEEQAAAAVAEIADSGTASGIYDEVARAVQQEDVRRQRVRSSLRERIGQRPEAAAATVSQRQDSSSGEELRRRREQEEHDAELARWLQGSEEDHGGWGMLLLAAGETARLAGGAQQHGGLLADPEPALAEDSAARLRIGDTVLYRGRAGTGAEIGVIRQITAGNPPSYVVRLESGREVDTVAARLTPRPDGASAERPSGLGGLGTAATQAGPSTPARRAEAAAVTAGRTDASAARPAAAAAGGGQAAGDDGRERCAVCLSEFEEGENVLTLPCCHTYHNECINRWLARSRLCPICRHEIS